MRSSTSKKVLVACEFSGVVRDAFAALGHDAWSCDLEPTETPGQHIRGDVRDYLEGWDLIIAHPPCTYLTVAGNKWNNPEYRDRFPDRPQQTEDAVQFFKDLYNAPCERVCIENPVGIMSSRFRKPDQYVCPTMFGHKAPKKTGLWLRGLPKLKPTNVVELTDEDYVVFKSGKRWSRWYYETGNERTPALKAKARNRTFEGIAHAMASQWG